MDEIEPTSNAIPAETSSASAFIDQHSEVKDEMRCQAYCDNRLVCTPIHTPCER